MKNALCAALIAGMTASATSWNSHAAENAELTAAQSQEFGRYVADGDGRALYMFTTDTRGEGNIEPESSCYDACAEAWPPLLAEASPPVGDKLDKSKLGSFQRQGGKTQITYGGWPLYYYVKDSGSGSVTGQDVHGFGGEWYLVTPEGGALGEPDEH